MVHPSAFLLNGLRLVVVATPGRRNGPLLYTRSDDDDDDKLLVHVEFYLYPTVGTVLIHSVKPELTE